MHKEQPRTSILREIKPTIIGGFALFFAGYQLLMVSLFPVSEHQFISPLIVACLATVVLIPLAFGRKATRLKGEPTSFILFATLGMSLVGLAGGITLLIGVPSGSVIAYVMACLMGSSFAVCITEWARVFKDLDAAVALLSALIALVIVGILDVIMGLLPHNGLIVMAVILYAGAGLILVFIEKDNLVIPSVGEGDGEDQEASDDSDESENVSRGIADIYQRAVRPYRRFALAYGLFLFVFGITFGVSAYGGVSDIPYRLLVFAPGCIGGAFLFLLLRLVGKESFGLKSIGQIISPLLVVMYVCYLIFEGTILNWLVNITFSLWWITEVFILLTLVVIAKKSPARQLQTFVCLWVLSQLMFTLGIVFGQGSSFFLGNEGLVPTLITAMSVILVVLAASMLIGAPSPLDLPKESQASTPAAVEDDPLGVIYANVAQTHKLTKREEEVMILIAQGHTRNGIAKKLFVSDNTVRAHVKSIYNKLHIHSKQELVDIIDSHRQ